MDSVGRYYLLVRPICLSLYNESVSPVRDTLCETETSRLLASIFLLQNKTSVHQTQCVLSWMPTQPKPVGKCSLIFNDYSLFVDPMVWAPSRTKRRTSSKKSKSGCVFALNIKSLISGTLMKLLCLHFLFHWLGLSDRVFRSVVPKEHWKLPYHLWNGWVD